MAKRDVGLLARLFRRGQGGDLVGELHARAVNRPLLVEPHIGQSLLNAYLRAGNEALQNVEAAPPGQQPEPEEGDSKVAVIEISGPLVARPAGLCSPLSYEDIRGQFDRALGDPNVSAVVLRLDSPGGEASQVFDLADHIRESRGTKPIYALADDMAYSAAYAIAAAADEVWLSRTAGVGSVGVVAYHVDASEMFESAGVRVEYLYAGDRKIDGNPHNPLSDEARERFMAEINRLYELFVTTVAESRGLDADAVRATEATTFHGERAVEAGFADQVGTFYELAQYLTSPDAGSGAAASAGAGSAAAITARTTEPAVSEEGEGGAGTDGEADDTAGQAGEEEPATAEAGEQASAYASQAAEIRAICAAAGISDAAEDYIQAAANPDTVRKDLYEMLAAGEQEIRGSRAAESAPERSGARAPDPDAVHAQLNNPQE